MKSIHFPFYIENGSIKVVDSRFNNLLYVQRLLQLWCIDKYESIENLKFCGLFKTYIFKNMNNIERNVLIKELKNLAENYEKSIKIKDIKIYSRDELADLGLNVNKYPRNSFFLDVTFLVKETNVTVNSIITQVGEIFNFWEKI